MGVGVRVRLDLLVNREQTSFSTVRRSAWVADADALPTPKPVSLN